MCVFVWRRVVCIGGFIMWSHQNLTLFFCMGKKEEEEKQSKDKQKGGNCVSVW